MKRRVVVTGVGVVTSLSCQVEDLWQRVLAGQSGIHVLRLFDTSNYKVRFGGDVYDWDPVDYIGHKELKRIDRFTQFALVAATDAVNHSGLDFRAKTRSVAASCWAPESAACTRSRRRSNGCC